MQMVEGRLYVFGGTYKQSHIGCNLFMILDLGDAAMVSTVWDSAPRRTILVPDRGDCAWSWVNRDRDRMYLMCGEANRHGAKLSGDMHDGTFVYGCVAGEDQEASGGRRD